MKAASVEMRIGNKTVDTGQLFQELEHEAGI